MLIYSVDKRKKAFCEKGFVKTILRFYFYIYLFTLQKKQIHKVSLSFASTFTIAKVSSLQ